MLLMLSGWEILLLGAVAFLFIGLPLAVSALILWMILRKKDSRVPPIIRS